MTTLNIEYFKKKYKKTCIVKGVPANMYFKEAGNTYVQERIDTKELFDVLVDYSDIDYGICLGYMPSSDNMEFYKRQHRGILEVKYRLPNNVIGGKLL